MNDTSSIKSKMPNCLYSTQYSKNVQCFQQQKRKKRFQYTCKLSYCRIMQPTKTDQHCQRWSSLLIKINNIIWPQATLITSSCRQTEVCYISQGLNMVLCTRTYADSETNDQFTIRNKNKCTGDQELKTAHSPLALAR